MNPRHTVADLRAKLDDLTFLEDELDAAKAELVSCRGMVHDLDRDNKALREENELLRVECDKYRSYAVNITTRIQVISENVDSVIREASRSAVSEAARLQESRSHARRIAQEQPIHPVRKAAQEAAAERARPYLQTQASQDRPESPSAALLPEVEEDPINPPMFLRSGRTTMPPNEFR